MQNRCAVAIVALAVLLTLSGCGGNLDAEVFIDDPPGVENGTLENVSTLLDAHTETLFEEGYVVNDTFYDQNSSRVAAIAYGDEFALTYPSEPYGYWANETLALKKVQDRVVPANRTLNATAMTRADYLEPPLGWGTYERTGTTGCVERGCIVLRANESDASSPNIQNFTASVAVDSDGVIHRFNASGMREGDGDFEARHFDYQYRLVEFGNVSVDRPAWVEEYLSR